MKQYWQVYLEFFKTSLFQTASFRVSFALAFLIDIAFFISTIAHIDIIYSYVGNIGPWNKEQFMFFIGFILVVDAFHMSLLSGNFWMMAEDLKLGNIDFALLRPISTPFIVFFRYIRISSLFTTVLALLLLCYFGIKAQLTPISWALLPVCLLFSFALMAMIEFIIAMAMFWSIEGAGVNFLRMQFQHLARYPDFIYQALARRVLTFVIPILVTGSAPCHFLLDPYGQWPQLCLLIFATVLSVFVFQKLWKVAVDRYESASS